MAKLELPRVVSVDGDVTFAFAPRVAVAVWRKDVTMVQLQAFERELRAFIPECEGRGYASITVIEPTISLRLPDDVRAASEKLQRECASHIKCMAYLVETRGFVAAAARTIASGFTLITRAPYPLKVFGSTDEVALWAAPYVNVLDRDIQRLVNKARAS
jgi:hypothetical protein